jgi:primosomal protein N' (replication factor Y)
VLLQTYMPDHPVMAAMASGERDRFLAAEIAARESGRMPPFGRLVALIVSGTEIEAVAGAARRLGRCAPHGDGVQVWGPAPSPMALLRGRHRQRLLLCAPRNRAVQPLVRRWLVAADLPAKVRVQIDVDPYSFL